MNFEDLLPDVLPYVPGCTTFVAADHILRAAREFCRRTHVWQAELTPFNTVAATASYVLAPPADSSIVRLFRVDVGDEADIDLLDEVSARANVAAGCSDRFAWLSGNSLLLNPVPDDVQAVQVHLSLKPAKTATGWPDDLGEDHAEALTYGALSTLFDMPRADWASGNDAIKNSARFEAKVARAARNRTKGRATARGRSKPKLF